MHQIKFHKNKLASISSISMNITTMHCLTSFFLDHHSMRPTLPTNSDPSTFQMQNIGSARTLLPCSAAQMQLPKLLAIYFEWVQGSTVNLILRRLRMMKRYTNSVVCRLMGDSILMINEVKLSSGLLFSEKRQQANIETYVFIRFTNAYKDQ